jgi:hypothetical protein
VLPHSKISGRRALDSSVGDDCGLKRRLSIRSTLIFNSSVEDGKPSGSGVNPNRVGGGVIGGCCQSHRRLSSAKIIFEILILTWSFFSLDVPESPAITNNIELYQL